MEISTGTLLIIAIVCAVIGYVAGIAVTNLGREKNEIEERLEAIEPPAAASPESGELASEAAAEVRAEAQRPEPVRVEALRLVRDDPRSALKIQYNGKTFAKAADMTSLQRGEVEEVTVELLGWLGYNPAQRSQPPAQAPAAVVDPAPAVPAAEKIMPAVIPTPIPKDKPKSIVGQINDILQDKLVGTEFEDQGVQLLESSTHGVMVQIGLETYQGIDEVPVEEIRRLIRASVAVWEKTSQ